MPVWIVPPVRVPVTTVPLPATENTRSMCSRGEPAAEGEGRASNCQSRAARSWVSPWPVTADTGITGASSRKVPCTRAAIWARTPGFSPRSARVRATTPRRTPSRDRIARCSLVWGMGPWSAATASSARSIPAQPESMVGINFSWPGTSTTLISRPPGRVRGAKPSSMVSPRRRSSASRSGSTPVRAFTRAVLPWSTWPAVPRIMALPPSSGRGRLRSRPHPPAAGCAHPATACPCGCGR